MPSLSLIAVIGWLATLVAGAGGTLWYRAEYESELAGRATDKAAAAEAVANQKTADERLSADLLDRQKRALDALHAQALSDLKATNDAPKSTTCGPVMRAGSRSVRDIIDGNGDAGQPAARP